MPSLASLEVEGYGVSAVATVESLFTSFLERASEIKPTNSIEPALKKSDFDDLPGEVSRQFSALGAKDADGKKGRQYAIVETAVRNMFGSIVANTAIDSPDFVRVWNLLDILSILADSEECDPLLLFWLVEELLDSQTIAGCRKVFDFLESRRETITPRLLGSTKLVILRSCNDLLRRLSRAEDTPFCGRVFIFLFQVFPLGDKSSVNLRGEYHVENVTTYDTALGRGGDGPDVMDVDAAPGVKGPGKAGTSKEPPVLEPDALYGVFWSLQASFSQPKRLFDPVHFAQFKFGLGATLAAFKQIKNDHGPQTANSSDEARRGAKRKRDQADEELADTYNPKYLTSRDLFELETSDLTFRRHFLVQALIITEFLLSLTAEAKEKMAMSTVQNKSVMYSDQVLSEEDARWLLATRKDMHEYLRSSHHDGPYFLRMVDTILARDKNWVRWKVESCPSIELPAVTANAFADAKDAARRAFSNRRIRPVPMGSLSLDFLGGGNGETALEKLKSTERSALPTLESFRNQIAEEDLEIEMPSSDKSKAAAVERKASKTWRALRIARRCRLTAFDKIDDDNKIDTVFTEDKRPARAADPDKLPTDTRPVVLSGPQGAGKFSLARKLVERNPDVFGEVLQHTTQPDASEDRYRVVDSKVFQVMLDGDRFVESSEVDGYQYGTSRGLVDAVRETGQVPLIRMSRASIQQAREMEFEARFVFVQPPSTETLAARLREGGKSEQKAQALATAAVEDLEYGKSEAFDQVILNNSLEEAAAGLEAFIYGTDEPKLTNGATSGVNTGLEGSEKTDRNGTAVQGAP